MLKSKVIELLKDNKIVIMLGTSNVTVANKLVSELTKEGCNKVKLLPLSVVSSQYTNIFMEDAPYLVYNDHKSEGITKQGMLSYKKWLRDFVAQICKDHNAYVAHCKEDEIVGLTSYSTEE